MTIPDTLSGLNVFITGGASGLGLALGRRFLLDGANVYLADIAEQKVAEKAAELAAETDRRCVPIACDVASDESVDQAIGRAWDLSGGLDLVCANAGVVKIGSILEVSRRDFDWVMGVNAWGIVNVARSYVGRARMAGRAGHILITGSENSLSYPLLVHDFSVHAYNVSKHAALAVADILRVELEGEAIGVSLLCPHAFSSGIGENSAALQPADPAARPASPARTPEAEALQKLNEMRSTADEVADVAIRGLRDGLFVIPTHPSIRDDVTRRYDEILEGFSVLER